MPYIGTFTQYDAAPVGPFTFHFYKDENGNDWYERQKTLQAGTYVGVKNGVVSTASNDFTMINPEGLAIYCLAAAVADPSTLLGMLFDAATEATTAPAAAKVVVITAAQAKVALFRRGLLDQVDAVVAAYPKDVQLWYQYAKVWERENTYVLSIAAQLSLTAAQMDDLFAYAATLNS